MMAVFFFIAHEKFLKCHAQPQTGAYSCSPVWISPLPPSFSRFSTVEDTSLTTQIPTSFPNGDKEDTPSLYRHFEVVNGGSNEDFDDETQLQSSRVFEQVHRETTPSNATLTPSTVQKGPNYTPAPRKHLNSVENDLYSETCSITNTVACDEDDETTYNNTSTQVEKSLKVKVPKVRSQRVTRTKQRVKQAHRENRAILMTLLVSVNYLICYIEIIHYYMTVSISGEFSEFYKKLFDNPTYIYLWYYFSLFLAAAVNSLLHFLFNPNIKKGVCSLYNDNVTPMVSSWPG